MAKPTRAYLFTSFVQNFSQQRAAGSEVSDEELAALSVKLSSFLPASYVQFMSQCGAVYCPAILRLTLEFELEHPDLRQFLTPSQVLERSQAGWTGELPTDLFVFATDCMGNPFCFRRSNEMQDDAPVFFLPSQLEDPIQLGESFEELLRWYVEHVRQVSVPLKSQ